MLLVISCWPRRTIPRERMEESYYLMFQAFRMFFLCVLALRAPRAEISFEAPWKWLKRFSFQSMRERATICFPAVTDVFRVTDFKYSSKRELSILLVVCFWHWWHWTILKFTQTVSLVRIIISSDLQISDWSVNVSKRIFHEWSIEESSFSVVLFPSKFRW